MYKYIDIYGRMSVIRYKLRYVRVIKIFRTEKVLHYLANSREISELLIAEDGGAWVVSAHTHGRLL